MMTVGASRMFKHAYERLHDRLVSNSAESLRSGFPKHRIL
jgi:hypothetical protein